MILYGAFKGMGDLICAAPAIKSELQSGNEVTLLIFPQVTPIIDLLDFGANAGNLRSCKLPVRGAGITLREFFRDMSRLSPSRIYVSPHAPLVVASWKIPILLWTLKKRYWPQATLIGAENEPLSRLFGMRIPVSRDLPYMLREWTSYSGSRDHALGTDLQPISFKESIAQARQLPHEYDLVIHPGAGTDNRKWPAGYFARLIGDLPAAYRVAVVGVPGDVAALRAVLPADRAIAFLSGSLKEAIVSIARSWVALTMDSGSMFFASLLQVPTVTLFGPSNPANVMISRPNFIPIYEEKWSCQPCRRPQCAQRQVYCMAGITPGKVLDAIIHLRRSAA
jgi:heptosyltransferase-2